ncbi:MAG: DUF501 domain-containing protein [Synergistaceae bacterium]|jgi:hypothetical protein|nr:DUF501 domain-containing protein [Synergistaceae bacterium]
MSAIPKMGGDGLPFFYERLSPDIQVVLRQTRGRKFDPSLILGVANRCRFGFPRVTICSPLRGSTPFPTTFWLTCPWLIRRVGALEAEGGVGELERWIEAHALHEWAPFNVEHQRLRLTLLSEAERPQILESLRAGGVGGIRYAETKVYVKCVHLQAASWLALGHHPGQEWLEARGASQECRDATCGRLS